MFNPVAAEAGSARVHVHQSKTPRLGLSDPFPYGDQFRITQVGLDAKSAMHRSPPSESPDEPRWG